MHFKKFEYLREFEFIFEKALAPELGAQDGRLMKKTRLENLVTLSLETLFRAAFIMIVELAFRVNLKASDLLGNTTKLVNS
jgi:hypothetical protein